MSFKRTTALNGDSNDVITTTNLGQFTITKATMITIIFIYGPYYDKFMPVNLF
jgi:hypothetical protein